MAEAQSQAILRQREAVRYQLQQSSAASRELRETHSLAKRKLWAMVLGLDKGTAFLAWRDALKAVGAEKKAERRLQKSVQAALRVIKGCQAGKLIGGLTAGRCVVDRYFVGWKIWTQLMGPTVTRHAFLTKENARLRTSVVDERLRQEELRERCHMHEVKADLLLSQHREARTVGDLLGRALVERHQALSAEVGEVKAELDLLWRCERNLIAGAGELNTSSMTQMLRCLLVPQAQPACD